MMTDSLPTVPRWFRFWRASITATVILIILGVGAAIPLWIINLTPAHAVAGFNQNPVNSLWLQVSGWWMVATLLAGLIVGLLTIIVGAIYMVRSQTRKSVPRKQFLQDIAKMLALLIFSVIGLALSGPILGSYIDWQQLGGSCSYHLMVVAYEDGNNNQVRDDGEPGLAQINATLRYTSSGYGQTPDRSAVTDETGIAQFERIEYTCDMNSEKLSVSVALPPGYTTNAPLSYGPFPVSTSYPSIPLHVIYVGFQKQ